jgi:hypothetical protein
LGGGSLHPAEIHGGVIDTMVADGWGKRRDCCSREFRVGCCSGCRRQDKGAARGGGVLEGVDAVDDMHDRDQRHMP